MDDRARKFYRRSLMITSVALLTASILVVPVLVQASRQGTSMGPATLFSAAVVILGIAYVLWACAWTVPVIMEDATDRLTSVKLPRPLVRAALLILSPALLATSIVYGTLGGGIREFRRVRRAVLSSSASRR